MRRVMPESQSGEPRYTEKEVSAILKRAAELQGDGAHESGGTSLEQLQQAAAEIGIGPSMVERAAVELGTKDMQGPGAKWLGGPWGVDYEKLLPGIIDEDSWPGAVEDLRAETGRVGFPKQVGKGYEWLSLQPDPLHITFTPSGQNTRVRVTARFGQWGALIYTLFAVLIEVVVFAAFGKLSFPTPQICLSLWFGPPIVAFLAGRAVFGQVAKKKRLQTQRMIARLEASITSPAPQVVEAARTRSISYAQPEEQSAFTLQVGTRRE
jgi:hypothetical protein